MYPQYGELQHLRLRSVGGFGAPQQISTGFASWLCCCSDVTHWRSTKPCTTFVRLMGWYTIYTFSGALAPDGILPGAKFTLYPKSYVLIYWQLALLHGTRAAGVSQNLRRAIQGMELRNFRRGRHLYSTGRPSRWASAHILVAFERNSQWKFFSKRYGV